MIVADNKTIKDVRYGDNPIGKVVCLWDRAGGSETPEPPTINDTLVMTCDVDAAQIPIMCIGRDIVTADSSYVENGVTYYVYNVSSDLDILRILSAMSINSIIFAKMPRVKIYSFANAFWSCSKIASLDLSNFDTSNSVSFAWMFYGCSSLKSLNISNLNTSNGRDFNSMFYSCKQLSTIDLSKLNTSNGIDFSYMFYGCSNISSLNVSSFNTSKGVYFTYMFGYCNYYLTSLDLSNFDTSNGVDFSYMFYYCSVLKSLTLGSKFKTPKSKSFKGMFYYCRALQSLDLSQFNTSNVIDFTNMFYGCSALTTLKLGSDFGKCQSDQAVVDFTPIPWGTGSSAASSSLNSLGFLYNRTANGLPTMTLKFGTSTKALLSSSQLAELTAKGYTIT